MTTLSPSQVMEKFAAFSRRSKKAVAMTPLVRPPRGTYRCSVDGISISEREFRFNTPHKGTFAAIGIQIAYTVVDESSDCFEESWRGKLWVMPTVEDSELVAAFGPESPNDPSYKAQNAGEGQWKRIQMQDGRFKGLLATLISAKPDEIDDILSEIDLFNQDVASRKTDSGDPVFADVRTIYSKNDRTQEVEFDRDEIVRVVEVG